MIWFVAYVRGRMIAARAVLGDDRMSVRNLSDAVRALEKTDVRASVDPWKEFRLTATGDGGPKYGVLARIDRGGLQVLLSEPDIVEAIHGAEHYHDRLMKLLGGKTRKTKSLRKGVEG